MKLYLVRHGQNNNVDRDPDKNLSDQGKNEVAKTAVFLKDAAVFVEKIYHSGKPRSLQTAEILAGAVLLNGSPLFHELLEPQDPIDKMVKEIENETADLMIVGHLPYLERLSSLLLSGLEQSDLVAFECGAVLCIERFNRKWRVRWMSVPYLL